MAFLLTSPSAATWQLDVGTDGALVTTQVTATATDVVFPVTAGPILPCTDPARHWRLSVADDGSLTTTEV